MKSKKELIEIIVKNIVESHHPTIIGRVDPENVKAEVRKYLNQDFMRKYHPPKKYKEKYEEFLIRIATHQCMSWVHPLTCGVSSSHKLLVPKFDYGGMPYLICPTCGMVQTSNPLSKSPFVLLKEIYDAANGDWDTWMQERSIEWGEEVECIIGE